MNNLHIIKSKINKFHLPNTFDIDKIQIGIPVSANEKDLVGVKEIGDTVLPSGEFGAVCYRNAYGYEELDKTKPKMRRYVSTVLIYPYGNTDACKVPCDIYKYCWQKKEIRPTEIELVLVKGTDDKEYIIANLSDRIRHQYLKETLNIFLEIFGNCYVFEDELNTNITTRKRCNWEILPKGEKPSLHIIRMLTLQNKDIETFDVKRLQFLEKFNASEIVEGTNGFHGYYAFIFEKYCFLESAFYGNATYIIPKENWESLSQKTKQELLDEDKLIKKINHTQKWFINMKKTINDLGV